MKFELEFWERDVNIIYDFVFLNILFEEKDYYKDEVINL